MNRTWRQMHNRKIGHLRFFVIVILAASGAAPVALSQSADRPWRNTSLSPEERADLVLKQMTLEEKLSLLHGNGMAHNPPGLFRYGRRQRQHIFQYPHSCSWWHRAQSGTLWHARTQYLPRTCLLRLRLRDDQRTHHSDRDPPALNASTYSSAANSSICSTSSTWRCQQTS